MKNKNRVVRLKERNPFMSTSKIASLIGTTRQNVHNMLSRRGYITKAPRLRPIPRCKICGEQVQDARKWHSEECKFAFKYLQVTCSWCRIRFYRHRDAIMRGHKERYEGIYCTQEHFHTARRNKGVAIDSKRRINQAVGA